jgi:hypothetical protein
LRVVPVHGRDLFWKLVALPGDGDELVKFGHSVCERTGTMKERFGAPEPGF